MSWKPAALLPPCGSDEKVVHLALVVGVLELERIDIPRSDQGTVSKLEAHASEALADVHHEVLDHVRNAPSINMNETSWTEGRESNWLLQDRAERDIRPSVVWRRSSFGTDSSTGSRYVERILTAVHTCKKQGRRAFEFLTDLFSAAVHKRRRPKITSDSS